MNTLQSASFQGKLYLPKYVYHGTLKKYLPGLYDRLLDDSWWRKTDRDFGAGFYTTISFRQAAKWAVKAALDSMKTDFSEAVVLKIRVGADQFPNFSDCLVFLGDSNPDWTRFIVDHRLDCRDDGFDPCKHHPAIIIGQMADNKMEKVHFEYNRSKIEIKGNEKYEWYYNKMTQNQEGHHLDSLDLGNQICFSDPGLNEMLSIEKFYVLDEGTREWIEHG